MIERVIYINYYVIFKVIWVCVKINKIIWINNMYIFFWYSLFLWIKYEKVFGKLSCCIIIINIDGCVY